MLCQLKLRWPAWSIDLAGDAKNRRANRMRNAKKYAKSLKNVKSPRFGSLLGVSCPPGNSVVAIAAEPLVFLQSFPQRATVNPE